MSIRHVLMPIGRQSAPAIRSVSSHRLSPPPKTSAMIAVGRSSNNQSKTEEAAGAVVKPCIAVTQGRVDDASGQPAG